MDTLTCIIMRFVFILSLILTLLPINISSQSSIIVNDEDLRLFHDKLEKEQTDSLYYKAELAHSLFLKKEKQWADSIVEVKKNFTLEEKYRIIQTLPLFNDSLPHLRKKKHEEFLKQAENENNKVFILHALRELMWQNFYSQKGAESFYQAKYVEEVLNDMPDKEAPIYKEMIFSIGWYHLINNNVSRCSNYIRKALTDYAAPDFKFTWDIYARNTLGSYYLDINKLDSAEIYLLSTLQNNDIVDMRYQYDAIALANIGRSFMLRKNYDAALKRLYAAMPIMKKANDNSFVAGLYTTIGTIYLNKGDLKSAKAVTDSISCFINKAWVTSSRRYDYYTLKAKLLYNLGDVHNAALYMDSINNYVVNLSLTHTHKDIVSGEKAFEEIKVLKQETQLRVEQMKFTYSAVVLLLFIALIVVIQYNYYRIQKAYHLLAEKSKIWANVSIKDDCKEDNTYDEIREGYLSDENLHEQYAEIAKKIRMIVEDQKRYADFDITLVSLAREIGVGRNMLSQTINKEMRCNFKTYINNCRIQAAIRLLTKQKEINIKEVYLSVGFSDRSTFNRAFTKIVGLSPTQFVKTNKEDM